MNLGKTIDHLPMHTFRRCVNRYNGHYKVRILES